MPSLPLLVMWKRYLLGPRLTVHLYTLATRVLNRANIHVSLLSLFSDLDLDLLITIPGFPESGNTEHVGKTTTFFL